MATADKLQKLLETKAAIRQAITNKGVEVPDDTVFADYPSKISAIESDGSGGNENDWLNVRSNGGMSYVYLFYGCSAESLDVSSLDTSNAMFMHNMFANCGSLKSLDLSSFNTSKVTNMSKMFWMCDDLISLDLSSFDTSKVTDMNSMFSNCSKLQSLDVSNFDTSSVTDMNSMFNSCNNLATLDLSSFDTSKVTNMNNMFYYCTSLTSLDVSSFDTSKVTSISYIFNNCKSLTSLDLSNWDINKVTASYATSNAFNCSVLTDFKAPKNINAAIDFSSCTNLTHDSLMSIINNLTTKTSTTKLTLGATNLAKLSDDEIAIAVNRGWTLA